MSKEKDNKKILSLDETIEFLGAEPPEDIGAFALDPIGIHFLAARVAKRLSKRRGRPTDVSWDIVRKIPMKRATWRRLNEIKKELEPNSHVATGQLAAIALEMGLVKLSETPAASLKFDEREDVAMHSFDEETCEEAGILCAVIQEEDIW